MLAIDMNRVDDDGFDLQRTDFERFIISRSIESHSSNNLEIDFEGRYRNPTIQTLFVCWMESNFMTLRDIGEGLQR